MKFSPIDAYAFKRLLVGHRINGELPLMSGPWQPMALFLDDVDPLERLLPWQASLVLNPDRDAIRQAVTDADPNGPIPDHVESPSQRSFKMTRGSDVIEQDVEWLWDNHIPLGMLTLLAGDPKLGKSFFNAYLAAMVSRGKPMPGETKSRDPASVILMSAEDDPARTIIPRIRACGGDLERIYILESVFLKDGSEALPSLREDIAKIEEAIVSLGDCRLVSIDPVSAYIGGVDDHRNAELRGILSPLKVMAERHNVSVNLTSHHSKSGGSNSKLRVQGSIAYVGACRAHFSFYKDRTDPTGKKVLFCDSAGNLAPPQPTLAYSIKDRGNGPEIEWFAEPLEITADEAMAADQAACQAASQATRQNNIDAPDRAEAEQWLREVLMVEKVLAKEIESLAKPAGFSMRTLKRAKESIGIVSVREGFGKDSSWYWSLPDAPTQ